MGYKLDNSSYNSTIPLKGNFIYVQINGLTQKALLDTGSSICTCSIAKLRQIINTNDIKLEKPKIPYVHGISSGPVPILGMISLDINIGGAIFPQDFHIFKNINQSPIIGLDFLTATHASIDLSRSEVAFWHGMVCANLVQCRPTSVRHLPIRLNETVVVKPGHECRVNAKLPAMLHNLEGDSVIINPNKRRDFVYISHSISTVHNRTIVCSIVNLSDFPVKLRADAIIGTVECVNSNSIYCMDNDSKSALSVDERLSKERVLLNDLKVENTNLTSHEKGVLTDLIKSNLDVFSTGLHDLGFCDKYPVKIRTTKEDPIKIRPYRASQNAREEIGNHLVNIRPL